MIFIGVDLGVKNSGIAILKNNELKEVKVVKTENILNFIKKNSIVAIDCPLTKGKNSLRKCEIKLRERKIPCFPSKSNWTKKWVNCGIKLRKKLEKKRIKVIEVYPYATKKILNIEVLAKKIKNFPKKILKKDELDAIICAFTGYLYFIGRAEEIKGEGKIIVPKIQQ